MKFKPFNLVLIMICSISVLRGWAWAMPNTPDTSDVVGAYLKLRGWVDAFELPDPKTPEASAPIPNAVAVCVILRQSGRVVGVGTDGGGSGDGSMMLRRAAGRALSDVLADPAAARALRGDGDASELIGRQLTLELEVAHKPRPLLGNTFSQIASQLDPGLEGVAIRRDDQWVYLFPAQLRATNRAGRIEQLLPGLVTELGLGIASLDELQKRYNIAVYGFRTIHLTQTTPEASPIDTFRGNQIVMMSQMNRATIEQFTIDLAEHILLIAAPWPIDLPLGVRGDYQTVSDTFDPPAARPLEQALIAMALFELAAYENTDDKLRRRARSAATRVLIELGEVTEHEQNPFDDPVACAAIMYAVFAAGEDRDQKLNDLLAGAVDVVLGSFDKDKGFDTASSGEGRAKSFSAHSKALIAAAMSRLFKFSSNDEKFDIEIVRSVIDAAWDSAPKHQAITLLPWIGWAEADLAQATNDEMRNIDRLRKLADLISAARIKSTSKNNAPDLIGGIALRNHGRALPTAQTIRPAAWIASIVADPRLTTQKRQDAVLREHLFTMRFLMQLAMRDDAKWSVRNPRQARGGIRATTWRSDQPIAAQALGLMTAIHTLRSFDRTNQPVDP